MKKIYLLALLSSFFSVVANAQLIISEFRVRGPNGANDEFIEIYNASGANHTVAAVSGTGYGIAASDGVTRGTIPNGTIIPAKGHYLLVNSVGYSLASYPAGNGTTATGDATYTTDIPDNAGIAIFNNNTGGGSYTLANRMDAVGSTSEANVLYKEGSGYPALTPFSIDYCWRRKTYIGPPQDSNNNAADLEFDDTNGTSAGGGQRLGAPGPENLSAPLAWSTGNLVVSLLDQTVAATSPPNMVRDFTSDPPNNSTFGTLDLRYRITNNTGGNITRLRFRIDSVSTFPSPSGRSDLRPRTSTSVVVAGINDPSTCAPGGTPCSVTVQGTTLEQPPSQPNGGGFNSSMSVGVITLGTPLANGASVNIRLLFGIQQTGSVGILFTPEILPGTTGTAAAPFGFIGATDGPICTLTCPANITVSNDPNQCGAVVNYPAPTTSGTCGTVTSSPASGSFFPVGTTTVTANSSVGGASCSFTVTVNDTQPPTITCPSNIIVCGSQAVSYSATASDNCPGVTVSYSPASGSVFPVGTTTVTATATDASGNTATCTFTVTVNPIPTVNPVPNQTVCHNGASTPINFTGSVVNTIYQWTNNDPSIGLAASGTGNIGSFIANNPGAAPVTATITVTPTTNSNFFSQTFNFTGAFQTWTVPAGVTSVDIQAFGAQGNRNAFSIAGGLGGSASGTLAVAPGNTLYIYAGGGNSITSNGGFNGGGNAGSNTCLTAIGGGGGGASDVRLNVNALANRVLVAAGGGGAGGNRVVFCGRGTGGGGGGGYYGGGGGAGWPGVPTGPGPVPTGGTQVAGGAGGVSTFTSANNGFPGGLGFGGAGGPEVSSSQGGSATAQPGGVGGGLIGGNGLYNTANNWTGQSGAGGSSYIGGVTGGFTSSGVRSGNGAVTISYILPGVPVICTGPSTTFTITVNPGPAITCPGNVSVPITPGLCGAIVTYPPATATGIPAPTITYSQASGTFFPGGTTTVTATATNVCGTATCTFTVTVVDNVPPVITCPANITVSNDPNLCSAVVNYALPTITDNCPDPVQLPASFANHGSGGVFTLQGNTLPGGLFFSITNTSSILRTIKGFGVRFGNPAFGVVNAPQTLTVWSRPGTLTTAIENSTAGWTQQGPQVVNPIPPYFATGTGPLGICNLNTLVPIAPGATASFFIHGQSACPVFNGTVGVISPPVNNSGFRLTGGTVSFGILGSANHFQQGVTNGIINCNVQFLETTLTQTTGLPPGSAFPVGLTTNTFTATDAAGNSASCSFTVRVNDTQAPTVSCPGNITVTTPVGSCTAVVNYTVTAADNCPGAIAQLVSGPASGSAFPIGTTTVTWRAVDAAGNISGNCSFTVTVLDGQLPVVTTAPANRTVCVGDNATFSVVSTNTLSYQWQAWNGSAWVNIAGATSSSLTLTAVTHSMNTNSYRVLAIGLCTTVSSAHATLYVNPLPSVTLTTSIPPVLLPTQSVSITAIVSPGGGSYVWRKNGVVIVGATSNSISGLTVADVGSYTCTYTDLNGCVSTSAPVVVSAQQSDIVYIYPNPNPGQFHIRFYNQINESLQVLIYDTRGAMVYRRQLVTTFQYSEVNVDLRHVPAGPYVVRVLNSAGKMIASKWIVVYIPE
ncbi:MAG: HYR domain-containing protein [Sphingobacteriales bacterium]|nr:HYR domain-containing protein [Sphingobacteriales bacterium]